MLRYLAILLAVVAMADNSAYQSTIAKWREQREANLKADGGWLTVTGLFWLKEGENRVAGAPGVFELHGTKATFRAESGKVTEMTPEATIEAGNLTFSVIERNGRYGVRQKDKQSQLRKEFKGLRWYPVRESYHVQAKFVPQEKQVPIDNIIKQSFRMPSPGYVVFKLNGQEFRLEPVIEEGENELFFIFRDKTAGKETYPAGRYLYAPMPQDGKVDLDFNKAYNPPCAFTPYATCPLPPKQNILPIRIEAGELNVPNH